MPKTEYHARHILVATEPFAQKIIDRLDKGEKFDALAKEDSMDSAKNNGGDLGWFTTNRMVPEFAGAVVALKPGEYTHKPVQTQYGWHVIQLLETREVTPPPYDQVRQRLEQVVQAKKFRLYTDELLHNAKIEKYLDQPASGSAAPATPGRLRLRPRPRARLPAAPPQRPDAGGRARHCSACQEERGLRERASRQRLSSKSISCCSLDDRHAERLCLGELGAGIAAGDDVAGLLRDAAGDLGAARQQRLLRLLARHALEGPGDHESTPGERL